MFVYSSNLQIPTSKFWYETVSCPYRVVATSLLSTENLLALAYVEQYRKALKEGKTIIKRLQLLVLGEERVGKTSLIRSLLGKQFKDSRH